MAANIATAKLVRQHIVVIERQENKNENILKQENRHN